MINIVRRGVIGFGMGQVGRGGPGRRNGASRDISEEVFAVFLVSRSLPCFLCREVCVGVVPSA